MVVFVIPFISQQRSQNWEHQCFMLERTLMSLENQLDGNWIACVSCHEVPKLTNSISNRVRFYQVSFEPGASISKEYPANSQRDRNWKVCHALTEVKKYQPDYVMELDSDDWVRRDLVKWVHEIQPQTGVYFDKGYEVHWKWKRSYSRQDMTHICGSTFLLKSPDFQYLPDNTSFDELDKCLWLFENHKTIKAYFHKKNVELIDCPYPMIAYILYHGENDSQAKRRVSWKSSIRTFLKFYFYGRRLKLVEFGQDTV